MPLNTPNCGLHQKTFGLKNYSSFTVLPQVIARKINQHDPSLFILLNIFPLVCIDEKSLCGSERKQFPLFIVLNAFTHLLSLFSVGVWKLLLLCISLRAQTRHKGFTQIKFHNSVCHTSNELFQSHNFHKNIFAP